MALHISDPGHVALRRGIRAAVALPITLGIALYVVDDPLGAVFAIFGCVGLLIQADFPGRWTVRLSSYLLTGIAGTATLVIGWAAGQATVSAVLVTLAVAFVLGFLALVRGPVAIAVPAVQLIFIVAVSIGGTRRDLDSYLVGWWIAVVVATVTALTLLPRGAGQSLRVGLATAFASAADLTRALWLAPDGAPGRDAAMAAFDAAIADLDRQYGGKPYRATGVTTRDQSLQLLVFHLNSAHLLLIRPGQVRVLTPEDERAVRREVAVVLGQCLDDLATAMRDTSTYPSAATLDDARTRMMAAAEAWALAQTRAGATPESIAQSLDEDHLLRMAALLVEQMIALARQANGAPAEELAFEPPTPRRSWWSVLRSQVTPASPWFRNAARSALGLGLAVLVVNVVSLERGFWVLLGVVSVLRFDAVGTRRFAWQAVAGTILGVVVATVILELVGSSEWVLWVLLPLAVFLAAWSAAAINYPVGQAAFTALVLIGLGIADWPPQIETGLIRIEDVLIGACVALVVAFVMWPRGAAGALRHELARAVRAASAYFAATLSALTTPTTPGELDRLRQQTRQALETAAETYDMSLMQRGVSLDDEPTWRAAASALIASHLMLTAGRITSQFSSTQPLMSGHPGLVAALDVARDESTQRWTTVAEAIDTGGMPPPPPAEPMATPTGVTVPIRSADDAHAFVVGVWAADWAAHIDRLGDGASA